MTVSRRLYQAIHAFWKADRWRDKCSGAVEKAERDQMDAEARTAEAERIHRDALEKYSGARKALFEAIRAEDLDNVQ